MDVLVTGGAGFIGANLCRWLAATPGIDRIIAFDDLSTGARSNLDGVAAELVEGSILDADALAAVTQGVDAIVHLAARPSVPRSIADPMASHLSNATGTMMVLEAARAAGNPQVIVASSSSVYGANPTMPKHEDLATVPLSPYAASKLATEAYAIAYQSSFGLPVLAFRFFNVFGPLQAAGHAYAAVVPAFCDAALGGRPLTVHGDGRQSRDFTFVGTVVEVITDAIVRRVTNPIPVNLAFGTRTDLLALVEVIEELVGTPLEVTHTEPRAGDVRHSQADTSQLQKLFPEVEPAGLRSAVAATIDWFRTGQVELRGR
jgi:UDP-glucose 4-epimerase